VTVRVKNSFEGGQKLRLAVRSPNEDNFISFSFKTLNSISKPVSQWITVFETESDDEYDGNFDTEDQDDEDPRIQIKFDMKVIEGPKTSFNFNLGKKQVERKPSRSTIRRSFTPSPLEECSVIVIAVLEAAP